MPRANQHWVEELDFAIEEWTLDGVRLDVPGRAHPCASQARCSVGEAGACCRRPPSPRRQRPTPRNGAGFARRLKISVGAMRNGPQLVLSVCFINRAPAIPAIFSRGTTSFATTYRPEVLTKRRSRFMPTGSFKLKADHSIFLAWPPPRIGADGMNRSIEHSNRNTGEKPCVRSSLPPRPPRR